MANKTKGLRITIPKIMNHLQKEKCFLQRVLFQNCTFKRFLHLL